MHATIPIGIRVFRVSYDETCVQLASHGCEGSRLRLSGRRQSLHLLESQSIPPRSHVLPTLGLFARAFAQMQDGQRETFKQRICAFLSNVCIVIFADVYVILLFSKSTG